MKQKQQKQHWLTMLVGIPRSGKSTWIDKHKMDNIVVSNDWIRENILGIHYSHASNAIVWSIIDSTLRILLEQRKNVILDGTNHMPHIRKFYIDIAKEYGAKVKMVVFHTPLDVCLARNQTTKKLPDACLERMAKDFTPPYKTEYDKIENLAGSTIIHR